MTSFIAGNLVAAKSVTHASSLACVVPSSQPTPKSASSTMKSSSVCRIIQESLSEISLGLKSVGRCLMAWKRFCLNCSFAALAGDIQSLEIWLPLLDFEFEQEQGIGICLPSRCLSVSLHIRSHSIARAESNGTADLVIQSPLRLPFEIASLSIGLVSATQFGRCCDQELKCLSVLQPDSSGQLRNARIGHEIPPQRGCVLTQRTRGRRRSSIRRWHPRSDWITSTTAEYVRGVQCARSSASNGLVPSGVRERVVPGERGVGDLPAPSGNESTAHRCSLENVLFSMAHKTCAASLTIRTSR